MTIVRVFYNTTRDSEGRPVGIMDGWKHGRDMSGHTFDLVHTYEDGWSLTPEDAAEFAFRLLNVVDGTELPVKLGVRSMSTGDAVTVTTSSETFTLVCRNAGFERVDGSKLVLIGERTTQTFTMARDGG
jgi:hypothetical protein